MKYATERLALCILTRFHWSQTRRLLDEAVEERKALRFFFEGSVGWAFELFSDGLDIFWMDAQVLNRECRRLHPILVEHST